MATIRRFILTTFFMGVVVLGCLWPSKVYSQTSGGFFPLYGDSEYEVRRVVPPTSETNSWGIHGNVDYHSLGVESWFGTDFVGTEKRLYAPFSGNATMGLDPNGGYWVAIEGSDEWSGWFVRIIHMEVSGRVFGPVVIGQPIGTEGKSGGTVYSSHSHVILLWCEDPSKPKSACEDVPFLAMLDSQYWPKSVYESGGYVDAAVPADSEIFILEGAVAPDWDNWPGAGKGVSGSHDLGLLSLIKAGTDGQTAADLVLSASEDSFLASMLKLVKAYGWQALCLILFVQLMATRAEVKSLRKTVKALIGKIEDLTGIKYKLFPVHGVSGKETFLYVIYFLVGVAMFVYAYLNPDWVWEGIYKDIAIVCLITFGVGMVCRRLWNYQVEQKQFLFHPDLMVLAKVVLLSLLIFNIGGYFYGLVSVFLIQHQEELSKMFSQENVGQVTFATVEEMVNKTIDSTVESAKAKLQAITPDWLEKLVSTPTKEEDGVQKNVVNQAVYKRIKKAAIAVPGCPVELAYAIFVTETNDEDCDALGANCISPAGAKGPFQFMPGTWATYSRPGENIWTIEGSTPAACRLIEKTGMKNAKSLLEFQQMFTANGKYKICWNLGYPGGEVDGWEQAAVVWAIWKTGKFE